MKKHKKINQTVTLTVSHSKNIKIHKEKSVLFFLQQFLKNFP